MKDWLNDIHADFVNDVPKVQDVQMTAAFARCALKRGDKGQGSYAE
ncbi:hypothetical protein GCM10007853_03320 [Algimonas ampicilliniresistens]|jgi:hypothetical protein|uniref:Uncharacterized protein n=1 Tax=Algimonas ampicilliniresistens TaxID=1298735 RepID=A0ABQ5V4J9_9PROT|nr:hypothetical protein [Algimonas ampicilliniresistens]GLQ22458.1 hypothetical protein GCM10007853_03320 [Algimonas ampicilliniresistens]